MPSTCEQLAGTRFTVDGVRLMDRLTDMSARHLRLTFPETQTLQPVIYHLVKDFDVVPCIRRASIENHFGWMIAELSGSNEALEAALAYLDSIGVGYTNAEGDILEG